MKQKFKFPEGFLWGAAGSAYQTEGGNVNSDWWSWEHSIKRMDELKRLGKNPLDYFSGQACDFWNRYEEDFKLARQLNHNSIRIGVEWSRIEPRPGEFNEQALEQYEKMLRSAKTNGLTVFLTLHHFTVPFWFLKKGAFTKRANLFPFLNFAKLIAERLGEYVDFWITINEPEVDRKSVV